MRISKSELIGLLEDGHSYGSLGKLFCCSETTSRYWCRLYDLKSTAKRPHWTTFHKQKSLSKEQREHLSKKRKDWLAQNPDKHPWKRKDKFISEPCEKLKNLLKTQNIPFVEEFQPLLHINRFFSIDVAFPDKKIGIEINGNQHYERTGELKPYYRERASLIKENGWTLHEIHYSLAFNYQFTDKLIDSITTSSAQIDFDYELYAKNQLSKQKVEKIKTPKEKVQKPFKVRKALKLTEDQIKECSGKTVVEIMRILNSSLRRTYFLIKRFEIPFVKVIKFPKTEITNKIKKIRSPLLTTCECGALKVKRAKKCEKCARENSRKVKWPTKEELSELISKYPITKIGLIYGVSDSAVNKWRKKYGIEPMPKGYFLRKTEQNKSGPSGG